MDLKWLEGRKVYVAIGLFALIALADNKGWLASFGISSKDVADAKTILGAAIVAGFRNTLDILKGGSHTVTTEVTPSK